MYKQQFGILLICLIFIGQLAVQAYDVGLREPHVTTHIEEETDHYAVELEHGADPKEIAEKHGHEYVGTVGDMKHIHMFRKLEDTIHGETHPHHDENPNIKWHERQIARQRAKRGSVPTTLSFSDPQINEQWHLFSDTNIHLNAAKAWEQGITGTGVTIAVVDDGIEYTHPDLSANYRPSSSYDFNWGDSNPFPDLMSDDHGTSAAGVAAAGANSVCGIGVAYNASLSALRLISRSSTDAQEAAALNYKPEENHIYTNSWGPVDDGRRKEGPGKLAMASLENGIKNGRDKKGSIYVWAAGNGRRAGDNCNYDGWANSRYTISIPAVDYNGVQAWYSESCSMLVVAAPSSGSQRSITTTDLMGARGTSHTDCTNTFGGTSAAAPIAAGGIALVLQVNPNLTWRDVQAVLIRTALKTDPLDSSWFLNGAGKPYSHKYGFGLIDVYESVELARNWQNLPAEISTIVPGAVNAEIGENQWVHAAVEVSETFTVEHVRVIVNISHKRRGDLRIHLISPAGTESILAEPHQDTNANYVDWDFGSIVNWGETSHGKWGVKVVDERTGIVGTFNSFKLVIYGHVSEKDAKQ